MRNFALLSIGILIVCLTFVFNSYMAQDISVIQGSDEVISSFKQGNDRG